MMNSRIVERACMQKRKEQKDTSSFCVARARETTIEELIERKDLSTDVHVHVPRKRTKRSQFLFEKKLPSDDFVSDYIVTPYIKYYNT